MSRKKQKQKKDPKKGPSRSTPSRSPEENKEERSTSTKENSESKPEATEPSKTNDPEWYSRDPQLLIDGGSIPFSDVYGRNLRLITPGVNSGMSGTANVSGVTESVPVPGVCTLFTYPSLGFNMDRNDPANVAATALYTHVRYVNSGRKNYDQADLLIYCCAIGELYAFVNWMIRIYNCAFVFSQRNLYVGKKLLEAQGVQASVADDLAKLRYWINVYINKIASFAAPSDLYYFQRRAFMYANVYTESEEGTIKDQLYMYAPAGFYKFGTDEHGAGMLKMAKVLDRNGPNVLLSLADIQAIGEELLADMWGDEDFGIMSGDILRAFEGRIITASPIGTEGGILPIYDKAVLTQMHNARIVNVCDPTTEDDDERTSFRLDGTNITKVNSGCVYQDAQGNLRSYTFIRNSDMSSFAFEQKALLSSLLNPVIDLEDPIADPAMVVEATRCMAFARRDTVQSLTSRPLELINSGDTIVCAVGISYNPGLGAPGMIRDSILRSNDDYSADENYNQLRLMAFDLSFFKHFPFMVNATFTFTEPEYKFALTQIRILSSLQNYTVQDFSVIERLHMLSLLSLLYVPGVAKQINYMK